MNPRVAKGSVQLRVGLFAMTSSHSSSVPLKQIRSRACSRLGCQRPPPARLGILRNAFAAMLADAEFRAEAERLSLPLATKGGEEMQKVVADLFDISPELLAKVRELSR